MVKASGAYSTQPIDQEDVDVLTAKCVPAAKKWQPVSEKLWANELPHYLEVQEMKAKEQEKINEVIKRKIDKARGKEKNDVVAK